MTRRNDLIEEAKKYFIDSVPMDQLGAVMLAGDNGFYYTNVPVNCLHHSPDGFSWGYNGSGPADLALNILETAVHILNMAEQVPVECYAGKCSGEAWLLHQSFKHEYIAKVPDEGGIIPWVEIETWLRKSLEPDSDMIMPVMDKVLTVAYPLSMLKALLHIYPNMDLQLTKTTFENLIEIDVMFYGDDSSNSGYSTQFFCFDSNMPYAATIVNDSDATLEETELALFIQDRIEAFLAWPVVWIVNRAHEIKEGKK